MTAENREYRTILQKLGYDLPVRAQLVDREGFDRWQETESMRVVFELVALSFITLQSDRFGNHPMVEDISLDGSKIRKNDLPDIIDRYVRLLSQAEVGIDFGGVDTANSLSTLSVAALGSLIINVDGDEDLRQSATQVIRKRPLAKAIVERHAGVFKSSKSA